MVSLRLDYPERRSDRRPHIKDARYSLAAASQHLGSNAPGSYSDGVYLNRVRTDKTTSSLSTT